MSGHHEQCSPQEVFLGNTKREGGSMAHLAPLFKTIRLGQQAYDIEGKKLPKTYAPLFLNRAEVPAYDAYMYSRHKNSK